MNSETENFDVITESVDTLTDIAKKSIEYLKKDYPVKLDWINTQLRILNESIAEKSNLIENRTKNMNWIIQNQIARQIKKVEIEQQKEQEKLRLLEQQKEETSTRIEKLKLLIEEIEEEKKQYLSEINYYGMKNSVQDLTQEEQKSRYSKSLENLQISRGKEESARRKLENANKELVILDSEIDICKKTIEQNNQTLAQLEDGKKNIERTSIFVTDLELKELQLDIETKKRQLEELSQLKDMLSVDPDDLKLTLIKALEDKDYESISECLNQFDQLISPLLFYQSEIHARYLDFKQSCNEKSYYSNAARSMDVFQLQRLEFEQEHSKKAIDSAELNRTELEGKLSQLFKEYQDVEKLILPYEEEKNEILEALSTAYMSDDKKQIAILTKIKDNLNEKMIPLQQKLSSLYREYIEVKKQIDFIDSEKTTYNTREKEIQKLKSKINADNYIDEVAKAQDEKKLKTLELEVEEIDKNCDLLSSIYSRLQNYCYPQLKDNSMQKDLSDSDITFEETPDAPSTLNNPEEISEDDIVFDDTPDALEDFETDIKFDEEEDEEKITIAERVTAIKDATIDLIKKAGDAARSSKIAKLYRKHHEKYLHGLPKNYSQLKKQTKHYIKKHLESFEDWEIITLLEEISKEKNESVKEQFEKSMQVDANVKNYIKLLKQKPADHIIIRIKSTKDGETLEEPKFKINPFTKRDKLVSIDKKLFDELKLAQAQQNQDIRRNNYGK